MRALAFCLLTGLALPAVADRLPLPADTPASYRSECASCHLPYPPSLLPADDWRKLMASLDSHFGSDATVDRRTATEIGHFLETHAGNPSRLGANAGKPPRISQSAWFSRKHREVPTRFWRDPRVKSAANCEACHTHAADGRYSEHDMAIPELRGR